MLLMARNGLKWPFKSHLRPFKNHEHSQKSLFFVVVPAWGALGGLNLDEIDATIAFLMLPMARNGLKWPFKTHLRPVKNQ